MLRTMVGDVPFWRGIREYYARYKDRNATTADFRQVMAETSGMDLEWFFEQWLYRGGVPKVIGRWSYDTATRSLVIDLEQTQPGPPYRLRVDIGVTDRRGTRVEQAELAGSRQTLRIAADDEPSEVVLDPAVRTLAAWSVNKATR
jgi:aminopeptidase N